MPELGPSSLLDFVQLSFFLRFLDFCSSLWPQNWNKTPISSAPKLSHLMGPNNVRIEELEHEVDVSVQLRTISCRLEKLESHDSVNEIIDCYWCWESALFLLLNQPTQLTLDRNRPQMNSSSFLRYQVLFAERNQQINLTNFSGTVSCQIIDKCSDSCTAGTCPLTLSTDSLCYFIVLILILWLDLYYHTSSAGEL